MTADNPETDAPVRRVSFTVTGYLRHGHPVGGWYDMQSEPDGGQPYTIPEFEIDEDSITDLPPEQLTHDDWAEIEAHLASRLGATSAATVLAQAKRSAAMAATPWETIDARPGETLRARLKQLRMSQVELARRSGLSTKHVNQVVKGAIGVSADVALLLERETGIPAGAWNRLDAAWRDRQARARAEVHPRAADR
jgi:addiction module HigA family antidote